MVNTRAVQELADDLMFVLREYLSSQRVLQYCQTEKLVRTHVRSTSAAHLLVPVPCRMVQLLTTVGSRDKAYRGGSYDARRLAC